MKSTQNYVSYAAAGVLVLAMVVMLANALALQGMRTVTASVITPKAGVLPEGTPAIYGEELGISYDDVSPYDPRLADLTIKKLADIDRSVQLEGDDLARYVNVLYNLENGISCEYCCGARSIIFPDGSAACGCAHSYAMRGLTKYLITQHGDAYTDAELLAEVGKWKTLFFPTQMQMKATIMEEQGLDVDYVSLASNKYRGIEQGATGGGMVGGC